jgi:hypothetical protein
MGSRANSDTVLNEKNCIAHSSCFLIDQPVDSLYAELVIKLSCFSFVALREENCIYSFGPLLEQL